MSPGKRGPKIPAKTRQFVNAVAISLEHVDREKLAGVLRKELMEKGWMTPTLATLQRMISKARNSDTEEDQPWCLGISAQWGIPHDANKDLLRIWKRSTLIGRTFTIREAKWAARIRDAVALKRLPLCAYRYAVRERVWEADKANDIQAPLYTSDIDAMIAFESKDWSYNTVFQTDVVDRRIDWDAMAKSTPQDGGEVRPNAMTPEYFVLSVLLTNVNSGTLSQVVTIGRAAVSQGQSIAISALVNKGNQDKVFGYAIKVKGAQDLDRVHTMPVEASEVYALWLTALSKGKRWSHLDINEQIGMANQLRTEIEEILEKQSGMLPAQYQLWKPSTKLFEKAGLALSKF